MVLFFFSVHTVVHTVNTMAFTIRCEIKSSAAILSWVQEASSQASKAKKQKKKTIVYFLLVTVGVNIHLIIESHTVQGVAKDSKVPSWMHQAEAPRLT